MNTRRTAFALAFLLGCGDDDPAQTADAAAPDAGQDASVLLQRPTCDFQAALIARLGGSPPEIDCGKLTPAASATDATAASECVLGALAAGKTFALIQGEASLLLTQRTVYVGGPALSTIFQYQERVDLSASSGARNDVSSQSCRTLAKAAGCTPGGTELCLRCTDEVERGVQCWGQAEGSCEPAGSHPGTPTLACCAGLQQVSSSGPGCGSTHACIEGYCGDGRCETAEADACGCALDCIR